MIKQIKFVSIPVADQNRALDFYTDKLGFTIITDQPFDEKERWIELRITKAETRVVLFTPEGDEKRIGSFMNMSYSCDDIDKTYAELKKRGVEFEGPPEKQPWGTYAMFKDSEGNRFVVSADWENSPWNDFPVLHEFASEIVWRVSGQPHNGGGAFGDGTIRIFAAHVGPDPAWTNAVH